MLLLTALGAYAYELQFMGLYSKAGSLLRAGFKISGNVYADIHNCPTLYAPCMVVPGSIPVKALLSSGDVKFSDYPTFRHRLQIPINRGQADMRKGPPHNPI